MTKLTVKVIVAMLGIGSTAALVSGAPAHSDQMQLRSGWVCNTYGHGGEKHASRPVTGEREATRGAAAKCHARMLQEVEHLPT